MTNLWKKNENMLESSAKVVDGNLIISLPNAVNPIVWRMELGSVKASALEVRKKDETGHHILFLKTPKGETHDIAPFDTKESAVQALMRVSSALQGAEGKMGVPTALTPQTFPSATVFEKRAGSSGYKWLLALGGVLFVVIVFAYLGSISPQSGADTGTTPDTNAGVPQSADDMLKGF